MTHNCHISKPGKYAIEQGDIVFTGLATTDLSKDSVYEDVRGKLRSEALIDEGVLTLGGDNGRYMFTNRPGGFGIDFSSEVSYTDTKGRNPKTSL